MRAAASTRTPWPGRYCSPTAGSTLGRMGFAEFAVCSGAVEGISALTESGRAGAEDAGAGVLPSGGGGDCDVIT